MPDLAFFSPVSRVTKRSTLLVSLLLATLLVAAVGPISGSGRAEAAGLIAPTSVCPNRTADGGQIAMAKARKSMTCMVNYARVRKGLDAYRVHRKLTWSAGRKAIDIRRCTFSHEACGREFDYWIRRSGYLGEGGWSTGENIAWGSGYLGNVRSIFIAWMKSKGHRNAILSRTFSDVGAGVVKGSFEGVEGARIWVLHFGDN
ncbi:MAG: CAP domain-containing protein [Solirubrobacterales bacterium]|nr:CAP domain-containing protein [Solirubrobacterales bacterium]